MTHFLGCATAQTPMRAAAYPMSRNLISATVRATLMNSMKMAAIVLIVAGALALAYGGFTYTKETHDTDIGPIHMSVDEKERVNIPIWAGVGAIVLGGVLLVGGFKK